MAEESSTFWTKCDNCNTQYEHLRAYLNQNLLCPNCTHGFIAKEKTPPAPSVNHNFQWDSSSRMAGSESRNPANEAANVVQKAQVKREFEESEEKDTARGSTYSDLWNFKRAKTDDFHMRGQFVGNQTGAWNVANGNTETPNTIGSRHPRVQGMLTPSDIIQARMEKGQAKMFKRIWKRVSEMAEEVRATEAEKKGMKETSQMSGKANEVERSVEEVPHASDEVKTNTETSEAVKEKSEAVEEKNFVPEEEEGTDQD